MEKMTEVKTLQQYIVAHRRLLDWLAKNPMKDKHAWPGWEDNGGTYEFALCHCFMCGIAYNLWDSVIVREKRGNRCSFCPLKCGLDKSCVDVGTPYWKYAKSKDRLKALSRTIFPSEEGWEQELDLAVRDVQLNAMAVRDLPLKSGICYDVLNKSEGSERREVKC